MRRLIVIVFVCGMMPISLLFAKTSLEQAPQSSSGYLLFLAPQSAKTPHWILAFLDSKTGALSRIGAIETIRGPWAKQDVDNRRLIFCKTGLDNLTELHIVHIETKIRHERILNLKGNLFEAWYSSTAPDILKGRFWFWRDRKELTGEKICAIDLRNGTARQTAINKDIPSGMLGGSAYGGPYISYYPDDKEYRMNYGMKKKHRLSVSIRPPVALLPKSAKSMRVLGDLQNDFVLIQRFESLKQKSCRMLGYCSNKRKWIAINFDGQESDARIYGRYLIAMELKPDPSSKPGKLLYPSQRTGLFKILSFDNQKVTALQLSKDALVISVTDKHVLVSEGNKLIQFDHKDGILSNKRVLIERPAVRHIAHILPCNHKPTGIDKAVMLPPGDQVNKGETHSITSNSKDTQDGSGKRAP